MNAVAVGMGCERGVAVEVVWTALHQALADAGVPLSAITHIGTLDRKADEAALQRVAADLGVPLRSFSAEQLEQWRPWLLTPSERVYRLVGCHGVAEAAALAAIGSGAQLLGPKWTFQRVTCAFAKSSAMSYE